MRETTLRIAAMLALGAARTSGAFLVPIDVTAQTVEGRQSVDAAIRYMARQDAFEARRVGFDLDATRGMGQVDPTDRVAGLNGYSRREIQECSGERLERRCRFTTPVDVLIGWTMVDLDETTALVHVHVTESWPDTAGTGAGGVGEALYRVYLERRGAVWIAVRHETVWVS